MAIHQNQCKGTCFVHSCKRVEGRAMSSYGSGVRGVDVEIGGPNPSTNLPDCMYRLHMIHCFFTVFICNVVKMWCNFHRYTRVCSLSHKPAHSTYQCTRSPSAPSPMLLVILLVILLPIIIAIVGIVFQIVGLQQGCKRRVAVIIVIITVLLLVISLAPRRR